MSHYWWGFADASTPDDWLNEGLAEYSAFMVSEKIVGREFADQLLSEYRQRASAGKTETAIAATEGNSPDREVNRYDKPVLLFHDAREKYGAVAWDGFLKALYIRFTSEQKATTGLFLDELGKRLGPDARASIAAVLYAKKWQEPDQR